MPFSYVGLGLLQVLEGRLVRLEAAVAAERARRLALEADLAAMQRL